MALAFLALAALSSGHPPPTLPVRASATASVQILSGARVTLGQSADHGNFRVTKASVRAEDGQRRPAFLVEFQ